MLRLVIKFSFPTRDRMDLIVKNRLKTSGFGESNVMNDEHDLYEQ